MEQKRPILYFCCSVNSRKSENNLSTVRIALYTIWSAKLATVFQQQSLYIDRCETRGANQLFSDPAWGTEQDPPDWGGSKGEILPVLGTTTGSNIVLDLNYCRVLGPWNGQYGDYYQYWESQQVQIVMTSTQRMKLVQDQDCVLQEGAPC